MRGNNIGMLNGAREDLWKRLSNRLFWLDRAAWSIGLSMAMLCAVCARAQDVALSQILLPNEKWQLVADGFRFAEGPAPDQHGNLFFSDIPANKIHRIDTEGRVTVFAENTQGANGLMFGKDGLLYAAQMNAKRIVAYKPDATFEVIAEGMGVNDLVVAGDGSIWFTDPPGGKVWYISPDRKTVKTVAEKLRPNGIILAHREGTIVVTDEEAPHLWAFRAELDGSLTAGAPVFAPMRLPFSSSKPGSDGMTVDSLDRVFVASTVGIQVFDTEDRFSGVIDLPKKGAQASNVVFGGPDFAYLYVTLSDSVYRLRTRTTGIPYFARDYQAMDAARGGRGGRGRGARGAEGRGARGAEGRGGTRAGGDGRGQRSGN